LILRFAGGDNDLTAWRHSFERLGWMPRKKSAPSRRGAVFSWHSLL